MSSHDRQRAQRRRFITAQNSAVTCIVANTVSDPEDDLYVKFPFAEEPNRREGPVRWQPKSGPVFPTRGDDGVCIYTESGEPWLVGWEGDIGDLSGDIAGLTADVTSLDGRLDVVEAEATKPWARMIRTTAQAIPHNGLTSMIWESAAASGNDYSLWSVANPTRITFNENGLWFVGGWVPWTGALGGVRYAGIRTGGSNFENEDAKNGPPTTGDVIRCTVSTIRRWSVGDYVELIVFQNQSTVAALNVQTAAGSRPALYVAKLSN